MNWFIIDEIIKNALREDMPDGDITTDSIVSRGTNGSVNLIAKQDGVIAGLEVFQRVFIQLDQNICFRFSVADGESIKNGQIIGQISGCTAALLSGERVALNFLQRMSGIATLSRKFTDELSGTKTKLLDTRKTTPNLRILEKYAVRVGGGCNHRANLSDGVLIKDNHINAAGGITKAIEAVRKHASFVRKIEVEVENLDEATEALSAGADIIMLDNMDIETMAKAVALINGRAITEASGNVTLQNIGAIARVGVDFISTGAVTHSYSVLDLSMKNFKIRRTL